MQPGEPLLPLWAMEFLASLFLYAWLFCVGASVGSFLNVVVYRLPRALSLVHPGSFCPSCGHAIRLRDNIPILGWLALRGRCRDCQAPISARYFWVELAVAAIFLLVAIVETKLTGTFPRRNWDPARWLVSPYETIPFWSAYALHVILLTTLLAAALIDSDRSQVPERLFIPVALIAVILSALVPALGQRPAMPSQLTGWQGGLPSALFGWALGLTLGGLLGFLWSAASRRGWPRFAPVGLFVAAGIMLDWRSTLLVAAAASLLFLGSILVLRLSKSQITVPYAALLMAAILPPLLDLDIRLGLSLPAAIREAPLLVAAISLTTFLASSALAAAVAPAQYFELAAPRSALETPSSAPADVPPSDFTTDQPTHHEAPLP